MAVRAILPLLCILACAEGSRFASPREPEEESYMKAYYCKSAQHDDMHVFTYHPRNTARRAHVLNARPTQTKPRPQLDSSEDIATRMLFIGGDKVQTNQYFKITDFQFEECPGTQNDPGKIKTFKLLGETIVPGDVRLAFDAHLDMDIASPIKAEVVAYKEIMGTWLLMPCYNELGSCTYADICQYSRYKPPCPTDFQKDGIPCTCPVHKGTYKSDNLSVYAGMTDPMDIPSWLTDGRYKAEITYTSAGKRIACYKSSVTVKKV